MKSKEEHIKALYGKTNPFRVPEGYFDGLSSNIMDKLPERKVEASGKRMFIRPFLYAACFIAVIFTIVIIFEKANDKEDQNNSVSVVANNNSTDAYSDEFVDYAMMDNMDIYACLASDTN